jgi:hypothetical protein
MICAAVMIEKWGGGGYGDVGGRMDGEEECI